MTKIPNLLFGMMSLGPLFKINLKRLVPRLFLSTLNGLVFNEYRAL